MQALFHLKRCADRTHLARMYSAWRRMTSGPIGKRTPLGKASPCRESGLPTAFPRLGSPYYTS